MAKTFLTNAEIMEKAQAEIEGTLYQIRRDTTRTEAYKKQEIARCYQQMRATRDRLIEERDTAKRQYQRELEGSIFGVSNAADAGASWAISRRDAGDRAAKIDDPTEALEMMSRAERSHDEPLARALAERAYEMNWVDVANQFLESRPHLDEQFSELWSQTKPSMQQQFMDQMQLQARPEELGTMSDYEVDTLASQDLSEAATSPGASGWQG